MYEGARPRKVKTEAQLKHEQKRRENYEKRQREYERLKKMSVPFEYVPSSPGDVAYQNDEDDINNPFSFNAGTGKNPELQPFGKDTSGANFDPREFTPEMIKSIKMMYEYFTKPTKEKTQKVNTLLKTQKEIDPRNIPYKLLSKQNHIILPMIGTVLDPSSVLGKGSVKRVNIGSYAWLCVLDRLRMARLRYAGEKGIEAFLLETAYYIFKNLNHTVLFEVKKRRLEDGTVEEPEVPVNMGKFDTYEQFKNDYFSRERRPGQFRNYAECFTMWYPDFHRQQERLEKNYGKLISTIRRSSRQSPFALKKINGKDIEHPHYDFEYDGIKMKNFLRHWTLHPDKVAKETYFFDEDATTIAQTSTKKEFRYPKDLEFSWIPLEHRAKIEQDFDLTQFAYTDPIEFNRLLSTWVDTIQMQEGGYIDRKNFASLLEKLARNKKGDQVMFTAVDKSGTAWSLQPVQLHLNYTTHSFRKGIKKDDMTMREFLETYLADPLYLPLVSVIANADAGRTARQGSPFMKEFRIWNEAGYIYKFSERHPTMYFTLNAPVCAFKHSLFEAYTEGGMKDGEEYDDCVERFIHNIYQDVLESAHGQITTKESFSVNPPQIYRDLLTEFINFNGIPEMCQKKKYPNDIDLLANIQNQIKVSKQITDPKTTRNAIDALRDGIQALIEVKKRLGEIGADN